MKSLEKYILICNLICLRQTKFTTVGINGETMHKKQKLTDIMNVEINLSEDKIIKTGNHNLNPRVKLILGFFFF